MGTRGVPWNVPRTKIIESIKRCKGRLTYVCRELNCAYITLQKKIFQDKEIMEIVDQARNAFDAELVDAAESYLITAMDQKEDLGNGLKAAFFALNNKGRSRGYLPPSAKHKEDEEEKQDLKMVADSMNPSKVKIKIIDG